MDFPVIMCFQLFHFFDEMFASSISFCSMCLSSTHDTPLRNNIQKHDHVILSYHHVRWAFL
jgi:hypothetical protein